ncbi:MAG: phosphatidate cytidylyltransferase [Bdellovibrionales bacterium]|nr:phosphatidate cytidylyltransferase [Bdellovibrionales bacterium]
MNSTFLILASVSIGLISLANLLNLILLKNNPKNQTLQKVAVIIKSWWLIIGFILLTLGTAPYGLLIGFCIISILCLFEYQKHSRLVKLKKPIATLVIVATCLQYYTLYSNNWSLYFAIPILFMFIGTAILLIISGEVARLPDIFSSYTGLILTFHLLSYLPSLYLSVIKTSTQGEALYLLFFVILLTELNDISQFLCGKAFGKHKWVPLLSPNKTDAGFIGGFIVTTALGAFVFSHFAGFSIVRGASMGMIISVTGILGDLTFSAIKRYFGTKDFSDALPGHGGILDRLDSIIFTMPSIFYFLIFT